MKNMYTIICGDNLLRCEPEKLFFELERGDFAVRFGGKPHIRLRGGERVCFDSGKCRSEELKTGTSVGIRAIYSELAFPVESGLAEVTAVLELELMNDGWVRMSVYFENEPEKGFEAVELMHIGFGAAKGEGYTVLPRMQGVIIPAEYEKTLRGGYFEGVVLERDAYMPMFGQVIHGEQREGEICGAGFGYTAIFDTPYDARYCFSHPKGGDTTVTPMFISSLGRIGYRRTMLYRFETDCDYNRMAKNYRGYVSEHGRLVTLREKIVRNPNVAKLIGTPVIHTGIATHVHPESHYYNKEDMSKNDYYTSFSERAKQLKALRGQLDHAYLHLDGWGRHGYDNLHPDPFPPHEAAGGAEGMKELADTCRSLGYVFGIHDQYRDYYYDAPSFDLDNAVMYEDGGHPFCSIWHGGPHSYLCSKLAPEYVKRNYDTFEKFGIKIEGAYLDVFSIVEGDECFNPRHRVTREQSAAYRRNAFDILTERGIIPSSEETVDSIVPAIALCHHAPFFTENIGQRSELIGYPIPLFNLVYHDCIVIPWFALGGNWGIPSEYDPLGLAFINGGTVYWSIGGQSPEEQEKLKRVLEFHRKTALGELKAHEFIGGDPKYQRSTFAAEVGELCVTVAFKGEDGAESSDITLDERL